MMHVPGQLLILIHDARTLDIKKNYGEFPFKITPSMNTTGFVLLNCNNSCTGFTALPLKRLDILKINVLFHQKMFAGKLSCICS
jgi:hypothetical protein